MGNGSLDFLDMIKNQSAGKLENTDNKNSCKSEIVSDAIDSERIAVIDTETNWHDQVMSIGVAVADSRTYKCLDKRYYIFEPEVYVGGIYSNVLHVRNVQEISCSRDHALSEIRQLFLQNKISKIFAYNAKFDYNHLPELSSFDWFDIMRLAAYKQFNSAIPDSFPCCKTGRLKTNYGVEPIMRLLSGNSRYCEVHNALLDAVDELKIVELLGLEIEAYQCGKLQ